MHLTVVPAPGGAYLDETFNFTDHHDRAGGARFRLYGRRFREYPAVAFVPGPSGVDLAMLAGAGGIILGGSVPGGYAKMGAVVSLIYVFGLVLIWLAPETKGRPLPD